MAKSERAAQWQEMKSAPKDGSTILLYFPGEGAEEVRMGKWTEMQIVDSGNIVHEQIGWRMQDRAEIRPADDPAMWCPISEPPAPEPRE